MAWMSALFEPRVAVLTGLGEDHLSAFGSVEAIGREKRALLERVPAGGAVVVPSGDPRARRLAEALPARVVLAGWEVEAGVRLVSTELDWPRGMVVELDAGGERVAMRVALHARHYAVAVALAAAAAGACGVDLATAARGVATFRTPPGRCEAAPGPNGSLRLVDDFKSRVSTACAAVRALGELPARRRIAVVGEVMEREQTEATYAPVAELLAEHADVVVAVGEAARPLAGLLDGVVTVERVSELAAWLRRECREGDVVLSHGSAYQHLERAALIDEGAAVGCDVRRCTFAWRCGDCPWLEPGPPPHRVVVP
jgi:UDP-N-acetylmuramoyl-tripeptide--D-alanyl-D-alanine ligase